MPTKVFFFILLISSVFISSIKADDYSVVKITKGKKIIYKVMLKKEFTDFTNSLKEESTAIKKIIDANKETLKKNKIKT